MYEGQAEGARLGGQDMAYAAKALAVAKRDPEVPAQLNELGKTVAMLENIISDLSGKIGPITRSDPPMPGKDTGVLQGRGTATEIGGQLANLNSRFQEIASRLGDLTRRIEL